MSRVSTVNPVSAVSFVGRETNELQALGSNRQQAVKDLLATSSVPEMQPESLSLACAGLDFPCKNESRRICPQNRLDFGLKTDLILVYPTLPTKRLKKVALLPLSFTNGAFELLLLAEAFELRLPLLPLSCDSCPANPVLQTLSCKPCPANPVLPSQLQDLLSSRIHSAKRSEG